MKRTIIRRTSLLLVQYCVCAFVWTADAATQRPLRYSSRHVHQAAESKAALPLWPKNYLLANSSVQLEPCSFSQHPRAWRASLPQKGGFQLPGTAAAQRIIWAHQHPADCSKVKFLVYQHARHTGLGATIDHLADALSWAMTEDRVLLLDYPSQWTEYCHGGALAFDECYFEAVSSCSLRDVYEPEVIAAWRNNLDHGALGEARKRLHGDRFFFNAITGQIDFSKSPPQVAALVGPMLHGVKIGGIVSEMFWWRAQGTAYILRPNARTLQVIHELKHRFFQGQTIAPGTISIHIRRGDKSRKEGGEMGYVPDERFIAYARALQSNCSDVLKPAVFVSTEDPTALESIKKAMSGWSVQFTTVPRNNHMGHSPFAHSPTVEALRAFLNLDLALECDGWVGTLGSLWSTMSERLRMTVRCKADKPYADGHGSLAGLGSV